MQAVHIRKSRRAGAVALAIGAVFGALVLVFDSLRTPLAIGVVPALLLSGLLLVLDRRVVLALSDEGIRYLDWSRSVVPWVEFAGYRRFTWRQQPYLQLLPRRPGQLAEGLSAYGKLNHACQRLLRIPPFSIAVTRLEVNDRELAALLAAHLPEQPAS